VGKDFIREVQAEMEQLEIGGSEIDSVLRHFGVDPAEVPDEMPVSQVGELITFRGRMRLVAEVLGVAEETLRSIAPSQLPTWVVQRALRRRQLRAPRAAGGDLTDSYLAAFLPYLDCLSVDRRTHEYLRQAKEHEDRGLPLGRPVKLPRYWDLPSVLEEGVT
jgi:hypothetical protein